MKTIIDLSKYLSIKSGHKITAVDAASTRVCLRGARFGEHAEEFCSQKRADELYLLGGGNNCIVHPDIQQLAVLSSEHDYIRELGGAQLVVGAATSARKLFAYARDRGLGGVEFLAHIPGQLGGLVRGNAGLPGAEISNIFCSYNDGAPLEFSYRNSVASEVIFSAILQLEEGGFSSERARKFAQMRANQPRGASFGSCFKNPKPANGLAAGTDANTTSATTPAAPKSAGALLESVGLRGYKRGSAGFSAEHANFLINYGGANFDEILALILLARKRVFERWGIMLEPEVQVFI